MNRKIEKILGMLLIFLGLQIADAQQTQDDSMQKKKQIVAEYKQSIAEGKALLKSYKWNETTIVRLKGEEKKREVKECWYGPDGKVEKKSVSVTQLAKEEPKSRRRKGPVREAAKKEIVENKVEDLKEHIEQVVALTHQYVPPEPQKLQEALEALKVTGNPTEDQSEAVLVFVDYLKKGDQLTVTFDTVAKRLSQVNVSTYLVKPEEPITLAAQFNSLPDGAFYMSSAFLDSKDKNLQIELINGDHHK